MDSLEETSKVSSKMTFFKYVFNFDEDSKHDMMNIVQYAVLAIIPVIVLNKTMQKYVPEADEEKGSAEILAEVIFQIVYMFLGLFFIHRIISYIPRYSGTKYPEYHVIYNILPTLVVLLSLQTKLGEKVSILFDRVVELWEGKKDDDKKKKDGKKGKGNVKVSQPISQGQSAVVTQSLYTGNTNMGASSDGTSISQLPMTGTQQQPDFNSMYRNDNNPMVGAATPGFEQPMIMAANEALGGSAFGSNF
jgi:hypothetical protein